MVCIILKLAYFMYSCGKMYSAGQLSCKKNVAFRMIFVRKNVKRIEYMSVFFILSDISSSDRHLYAYDILHNIIVCRHETVLL